MKRLKKGFTLLETIFVLTTALIIIASVFRIYYPANENSKINEAVNELSILKTGIDNLIMADRDIDLSNNIVLMSKIAPDTMIYNSKLLSPWKGDIIVSKHPSGKGNFNISYKGLPKSNCMKFISQVSKIFNTISNSNKQISDKANINEISDFCIDVKDNEEFVLSTYSQGDSSIIIATGPDGGLGNNGFDATPSGGSNSNPSSPSNENQPSIPTGSTDPGSDSTNQNVEENENTTPTENNNSGGENTTTNEQTDNTNTTNAGNTGTGSGTTPPASGNQNNNGNTNTGDGSSTVVDNPTSSGGSSGSGGSGSDNNEKSIFSNADGNGLIASFNKSNGSFIIKDSGSDYQLSFNINDKSTKNTNFASYLYNYIFENTLDLSQYNEYQLENTSINSYKDLYNSTLNMGGLNTNKIDFGDIMNIMSDYYKNNNYLPTVNIYAGYDNINSYLCGQYKFCSIGNYNGKYNFNLSDINDYSYANMNNSIAFNGASINKGENNLALGFNTHISNSGNNNIAIGSMNDIVDSGSNNIALGSMNSMNKAGDSNVLNGKINSMTNSGNSNFIKGDNNNINGSLNNNTIIGANGNIVNSQNNNSISGANSQINNSGNNNSINGPNGSIVNSKNDNTIIGKNGQMNGVGNNNKINGDNGSISNGTDNNTISGNNSSINSNGSNNSITGTNSVINSGSDIKLNGNNIYKN